VDQKVELEHLCALVKEPTATNDIPQEGATTAETEDTGMEVDVVALDHIVENVTYGLVEPKTMPLGRRRASPKKIDNEYLENNAKREFGLTS
jgi:hypothetical protein